MKKFFMFFIIFGIIIGIIIGFCNNVLDSNNSDEEIIEFEEEIKSGDINELYLSISDIDTLNPLRTKNSHIADILKLIYEPLISLDDENQIEGCLALEWMKKDDVSWIIKLRENVYWHSGEKFSANDVAYTINLLINNEIESKYKSNVINISSIDVANENTIVINLINPDPYIISKLTFPIVPKFYYDNAGIINEEKSNKPIGTGAYKYVSSNDEKIILAFNEEWWFDKKYSLKNIHLLKYETYSEAVKAFKSSEIDMIFTTMYDWKEKFGFIGVNAYTFESSEYEVIIPNNENKLLSDNSVRRAIIQAINRDNIVSNIYDGNAVIQDIPFSSNSKYTNKNIEYDVEKAKQILINASWVQTRKKLD